MATARLGHANPLLRDDDVAWRVKNLMDSRRYRARVASRWSATELPVSPRAKN